MASGRPRRGRSGSIRCVCLVLRVVCAGLASWGVAFVAVRTPPPGASAKARSQLEEDSLAAREDWHEAIVIHPVPSSSTQPPYSRSGAKSACFVICVLGAGAAGLAAVRRRTTKMEAKAKRLVMRRRRGLTAMCAQEAPGTTTVASDTKSEDEKERFRAVCTTLMREVGRAEEVIIDGTDDSGDLDLRGFREMLVKIEVECDDADSEELFKMLDEDGSGLVSITELKQTLRKSGAITELYNEGLQNAALTLIPAVILAVGIGITKGTSAGFDFVAGYVVEDSLSVDNLFVFLIIFKYFKVPPILQKTCLDLGIYGAVILRAVFIYLGLAAVQSFKPVLLIFAFILLYAAFSALFAGEDDDEEDEGPPEIIKTIVDALPTTKNFEGDKLFVNDAVTGRLMATPLALCILSIEVSDILFAVDSVPAVFAVTEDPVIVFTSNIAAILGLRSLYQILSIAVQDLVYLEKSAAIILGFVGVKLVAEVAGFEIGSAASLIVIISVLGGGIGLSLLADEEKDVKAKKKNSIERILEAAQRLFSAGGK